MASFFVPLLNIRVAIGRYSVKGLYPWARLVQRRAQAKAPVRTGRLRSRIRIVPTPTSLRVVSDAKDEHGFLYAAVQEKRRPYLRPAIRK